MPMFKLVIHHLLQKNEEVASVNNIVFNSRIGIHEVLPEHAPIITTVLPGEISYFKDNKEKVEIEFVTGGFLKFENNRCDLWVL